MSEPNKNKQMSLLVFFILTLLISLVFSAIIIKFDNTNTKYKQHVFNRRHAGGRNRLLDINKDLSV